MQTVETLNEGLKRGYRLTIEAKDIDARIDAELKQIAPQVKMPGFRPGKVPANLVRKMHGPQLQAQALETAIQEGVQQALNDNNIRPAMQPTIRLEDDYEAGKDAVVTIEVETLPDVPGTNITGLKLDRFQVEASEDAVDEQVNRMIAGQTSYEPAKATKKAASGDRVLVDFVGKVDGVAFEGGTGEAMPVVIGSGSLIPGFEDQLIGAKSGDQVEVKVTFPADYPAENLKGQDAVFDVTVNEVQTPKEAVADDDFAKQLGLESLEQLRGLLKGQVEQELNGLVRTHMKRQLLDQLAASHDFAVPETMVEAEFDQIWKQLEHEASHEADPEAAKAEMESERDDYKRIAERRVRLGLLLSDIGQRNGVEVTNQEMSQLVMQAAQQYRPEDRERFAEYIRQEPMAAAQLRAPLYEDKVVDYLFSIADITDRPGTREELEAEIEAEEGHVHGPGCGHDHHDHDHDHAKPAKKAAAKKPAAKTAKEEPAAAEEAPAAEAKPKKAPAKKAAAAPAEEAPAAEAKPKKAPAKKKAAAAE